MRLVLQIQYRTSCILQNVNAKNAQPRPQGHLCRCGEEIDDPGKGCPNLLVHWLTHSTSQGL